jgi:tetratricopeptide (TPR) repeat protein
LFVQQRFNAMRQPMPVVRQLQGSALIPQIVALAALTLAAYACFPSLSLFQDTVVAALAYLIFCRTTRTLLTRAHIRGIKAYRAQRFEDAITHFQASYEFFSSHRKLDAWRSLLLGVASPNPYRIIALCNMAYCYTQVNDGAKAIALYEQALQESPGCMLACVNLRALRSMIPSPPNAVGLHAQG